MMDDILFSSWGDRIVDNRGKEPQAYESPDNVELPEYFRGDEKILGLLGWDGIIIRSAEVDIIDFLRAYLEANYDHSKTCDKCNYCKTGWAEQLEVFQDILNGEATEEDLEFLQSSAEAVVDAGKCTIGKAGPVPLLHALMYFADDFSQAVKAERPIRPGKYHSRLTAPCIDACPIHLDIPKYVELIKDAKFAESLNVIRQRLPLPGAVGRVCVRPCEDNCRRANVDEPISIMSLKRFVADHELFENKSADYKIIPSEKTGKVAIVGAGPAGITCAYHLALKGHQVTVFEKLPLVGGMMTVGIPRYSLPSDILGLEIEAIKQIGVVIRTGVSFGEEITLESLNDDGFQAVFLGTGLHGSRRLDVEGEGLEGVISGIEFLRDVALGKEVKLGKKVIVIGGGNVAIDVARTAMRSGADQVIVVCLESREEMPAWDREIEGAHEEGIEIINSLGPKGIKGKDNKVTDVEFKRCTSVFDQDKRFNPRYDEADVQTLPADTAILAIGQSEEMGVVGGLKVDPVTFQTEMEWVFAGGDAVYGPESVVEAAASGRKAALGIDRFINNLPPVPDDEEYFDKLFESIRVYDPNEKVRQKVETLERRELKKIPPEIRSSSFDEIEQGFSNPDAVAEAERCLRCYRVVTIAV